jgi:dihydrofolate synthase/folylpolyglutamate synthase
MTADAILTRLTTLYPMAIDLSLDRMRRLLDDLGRPQDKLAPVIHVAGTNGKGSTIAYLRAMLEAGGRRVHVYTSPHLVRFHERIRLAGALIADDALTVILEEVERINAGRPITFFEVTTAAAFLAFARAPADAVLLEVGMGGLLDATNVVTRPAAVALTPISFDHMQHLGKTLTKIAGEKAGIIKSGVPAAVGPQPAEAAAVFDARAAELGVTLFRAGREWNVRESAGGFRYAGRGTLDLPRPALAGRHQIDNAGLAVAVSELLPQFAITPAQLAQGLEHVEWPARLQPLRRGPLVDLLPAGWDLTLDGCHNEGGAEVLAAWMASQHDRPIDAVFGILSTKDPTTILQHLQPYVRRLRAVTIPDDRLSLPGEAVAQAARSAGIADAAASPSVADAVAELAKGAGPARIVIAGSLHFAGYVLRDNG